MKNRDSSGKYEQKSYNKRLTKTIRVDPDLWSDFGFIAESKNMSRADLLEEWILTHVTHGIETPKPDTAKITEILNSALKLKANAGGAIKKEIRKVLDLID